MPTRLIASLALLISLPVAQAAPVIGVEWAPLSRGDLTWLEEDQSSGTLVGEHDGWLQPALRMYGGWSEGIRLWRDPGGLRERGRRRRLLLQLRVARAWQLVRRRLAYDVR